VKQQWERKERISDRERQSWQVLCEQIVNDLSWTGDLSPSSFCVHCSESSTSPIRGDQNPIQWWDETNLPLRLVVARLFLKKSLLPETPLKSNDLALDSFSELTSK
jgi:hypothetical protein